MTETDPRATRRTIVAGTVGSVLEWYDFAVYGYLAPIIGALFFPAGDPLASLLAAFGVFAIGFAARPVGGALFGYVGDRYGRKPALLISMLTPLWWLMQQGTFAAILAGQVGFGVLLGLAAGAMPGVMSEMLPPHVRCTATGIGYNVSLGLFGGTAPLVATYLIARTADDFMPAYYVMAMAAVSFVAALGLPETAGKQRS